ncbi:hypothetical protein BGZ96_005148 [Linnemannia gamsii]|uniref:Copper-fist domain-containing protein n=1 Tax=Linnemannia gamsii TaxID=64522 RepID=A0ABQ7KH67_9FUNG|nr:hypothetical protein BGZ96_005148 [Linnemannia gamsii]
MVFVNGQKFACATCIKGHRSTTCNHGERPLHEIKKKGRPSTQCPHCKELRKAKQVSVRCICGREEGAAAVANGLKRAKSLSHDGRLTIPAAIGGEDLLRSISNQGQSPQDSSSDAQSSTGGVSHCGCLDGRVCTCCRDRTGHVVVKPSKGSAHANSATFKNYPTNRQRSAASLDLGKTGMLLFPRDSSSPLPFVPHGQNNQVVQSPDSFGSQGKANVGIYASGASPLFAQTLSPSSSSGCDHSPSTSSLGSHQSGQMQSHLCFDYASSSDYDSDHYNPATSYSYFPETMASYPVSNASDDLDDMDMLANADPKTIMDGIMNGTTTLNPMESASADEIRMLYSALSSFDTTPPSAVLTPPSRSYSSPAPSGTSSIPSSLPAPSALTSKSGCCGSGNKSETAPSTMASTPSHSPPAGRSDIGDEEMSSKMDGCGCAISPNMCCCGERCACPGCLAYPNNQNILDPSLDIDFRSTSAGPSQTSGCCGSNKNSATLMNGIALSDSNNNDPTNNNNNNNINNSNISGNNNNNNNGQALNNLQAEAFNLSAALNLVQAKSDFDARQSVKQQFSGLSGLEEAKMQHPTLLGDNGVLICGCGCGRPTVDCAECFRDMCQFVSESQGRMMRDDLDFESALNGDVGGASSDLGLNMNMPVPLNMGMNMNLGMDLNMNMANFAHTSTMPQTMSMLSMQGQRSNGSPATSPSFEQQQLQLQQQQQQQQFSQDSLLKQQQQQQQLALQMQQRLSLRRRFREGMEEEQKLQLQLMEQEQMQLQQLQQSMPGLDHLQLDFLDDEDWSFVDEIRTDATDAQMSPVPRS